MRKKFIPHFNMTDDRKNFCNIFRNMSYLALGVDLVRIDEFVGNLIGVIFIRGLDEHNVRKFRQSFAEKARVGV